MAPSFCSIPRCSSRHKKGCNIFIAMVRNINFLPKDSDKYRHHESLQKVILKYHDPLSSKAQLHKDQCGICEKHFKPEDIIVGKSGFIDFYFCGFIDYVLCNVSNDLL